MKLVSAAALTFAALALSSCERAPEAKLLRLETPATPTYDKNQTELRKSFFKALESYETADLKSGQKGFYAQKISMAGREDILRKDGVLRPLRFTCDVEVGNTSKPLAGQVSEVIGNAQVVIINEHHTIARHRDTIRTLLLELRKAGFTAYAAESFSEDIDTLSLDRAIELDGYYTSEPTFGRLVNTAKDLVYTLVPYEKRSDQNAPDGADRAARIEARETAQAENLAAFLSKNSAAKILVHVGHSHVAEIPIPNRRSEGSTEWMASKFKKLTGIDPVTISQTACKTNSGSPILSSAMRDQSGEPALMLTDYTIAYPVPDRSETRGAWRRERGDIEVAIPEDWVRRNEEKALLFEARQASEPDQNVPTDRILVRKGEDTLPLLLPPGDWRLDAFDSEGNAETPVRIVLAKP